MALIQSLTVLLSTNSAAFGAGLRTAQSSLAAFAKTVGGAGLVAARLSFIGLGSAAVEAASWIRGSFVASMTAARAVTWLTTKTLSLAAKTLRGPLVVGMRVATAAMGMFRKAIHGVSAAMGTLLRTLGPLLALFGAAALVRTGAEFEKSMDRVLALTNASQKELAILMAQAERLGRDTVFKASEAAEAMQFFALAGFSVNEIYASIPSTLNLAAAGQIGIAESANIAAKIMRGMGIAATDLGMVTDVLAKAMSTANTDMMQLGEAMKFAGPIANKAGKGLHETVAAIQALSDAGLQGDMAGTAMRQILIKMSGPTDEAKAAMKKLGIEFLDVHGNLKPLPQIVDEMNRAMSGMGKGTQLGILAELFEARAATGFVALMSRGGDELRRLQTQLEGAGGTAERIATTQMDNLWGSWKIFTSAIQGLSIDIMQSTGGSLRAIVDFGTRATNFLSTIWPATASMIGAVASTIWSMISAGWSAIWSLTTSIFGGLGDVTGGGMQNITETIIIALTIVEFWFKHWEDLARLVGLHVALFVVRLGNQISWVFTEVIPSTLRWFFDNWKDIFFTLFDFTTTVFINLGKNIRNAFTAIWNFIKSGGSAGLEFAWTPLTDGFKSAIRELPQIAEREIGGLERALSEDALQLEAQLSSGANDLVMERLEEFRERLKESELPGAGPGAVAPVIDDELGGARATAATSGNRPKALERGTAEAFSASLNSSSAMVRTAKAAEETAKNTGAQKKDIEKMRKKMEEDEDEVVDF